MPLSAAMPGQPCCTSWRFQRVEGEWLDKNNRIYLHLAVRRHDSGYFIMLAILWIFRQWPPQKITGLFRRGQLVSAALYSLGHGGSDAQKTMGIIAAVLVAANLNSTAATKIPLWVVLSCHFAMAMGTLVGGWRIVHTWVRV